jgi:hypothetical protein
MAVLRTSSASNVLAERAPLTMTAAGSLSPGGLHIPPQDYVVVTGQKYRVRRTVMEMGHGSESAQIRMLSKALEDAHQTIEFQALEIARQNENISKLEEQLSHLRNLSPSQQSPRGLQTNRKKNRLHAAIESTKEFNSDELLDHLGVSGPTSPPIEQTNSIKTSPSKEEAVPSLFIAHDNPQLGKIVLDSFSTEPEGMSVMIETKDSEGCLRILLGQIVYSGLAEAVSASCHSSLQRVTESRGGQCLVCVKMTAFTFSLAVAKRRVLTNTTDINLSPSSVHNSFQIVAEGQLKEFFSQCSARVDVILSPFHDGEWYPFWENSENVDPVTNLQATAVRKLAPQFRSCGIGYLRLGDDMSSFGTSFLSSDGLVSFFDNQRASEAPDRSIEAAVADCVDTTDPISSVIRSLSKSSKWSDRCRHLLCINTILRYSSPSLLISVIFCC